MDILESIDRWGELAPLHPAHLSEQQVLTYKQLAEYSNRLAAYLAASLPADASPVAVIGHKEPEMLVAFLGSVKSGHPYIPIDSSYPEGRVERILKTAKPSLALDPEKVKAILFERQPTKAIEQRPPVKPDQPWYIIFTSGSTGEPKGVVITAGCLETFLSWTLSEHAFQERAEIFLNQAPFSFDLSVMDLYLSLVTGGTLFSLTHEMIDNTSQLFQALAASQVTTWVSTPSFAQMCLVEKTFNAMMLPNLRCFLFCGETLAPETASGLLARFPNAQVWNTYGPTETTVAISSIRVDGDTLEKNNPLPVGFPNPSGKIVIHDENGQPVMEGERGEIIISGPQVSPGYFGRPDLTAQAFFQLDGWRAYHTGDWGCFRDGMLFFEGRIDSQIKLHGYRIELGDVENNLRTLPEIGDVAVIPAMKDGRPDWLAAFVVLNERKLVSDFEMTRAIKHQLSQRLPAYMVPRKFFFIEAFPLTTNGKADRRKLAEKLA